jgi:hypothetical protein
VRREVPVPVEGGVIAPVALQKEGRDSISRRRFPLTLQLVNGSKLSCR